MEVLYSNIIKIVIVELNKKGKATPGMLTARQSWSLYFLHSHPDHLTSISLAKRVMEDVLKDIKETDTICTMTNMQREAGQTHFLKMLITLLIRVGLYQGSDQPSVISRNAFITTSSLPMFSKCPVWTHRCSQALSRQTRGTSSLQVFL